METANKVTEDIHVLPSFFPIPGFGLVPVNAYVLKSKEPVLVDTGLHMDRDAFLTQLRSVIDPSELKWLWLTHPDQDHVGSFKALIDENPNLKIVTTFLGFGIISLFEQVALDRVYFLNPGETLDVGDRQLVAVKPPAFDNPATTGFFDTKSKALFSSDCFGALVQRPEVRAEEYSLDELREGQVLWSTVDAPWLHKVDQSKLNQELSQVRELEPSWLLSSHLPPTNTLMESSLVSLSMVPEAAPFIGPNQPALEAMLAQMTQQVAATV